MTSGRIHPRADELLDLVAKRKTPLEMRSAHLQVVCSCFPRAGMHERGLAVFGRGRTVHGVRGEHGASSQYGLRAGALALPGSLDGDGVGQLVDDDTPPGGRVAAQRGKNCELQLVVNDPPARATVL